MKDLDFDELDRAVNSLMQQAGQSPTPPPADNTAPVGADAPPAIRRTSGRFMDVVVPPKSNVTYQRNSREGITIQPPETAASNDEPAKEAAREPIQPINLAARDQQNPTQENDWPDPLELANFKDEAPTEPSDQDQSVETVPPNTESHLPAEAMTSPFLPEAKVEKRPLGGYNSVASTQAAEDSAAPGITETPPDTDKQLPPEPSAVTEALPAELNSDILSVEADKGPEASEQSAAAVLPEAEAETTSEVAPTPITTPLPNAATATQVQSSPISTGSIPQQYKISNEPKADVPAASIYDTKTYHQPLRQPAKSKSGWGWLIGIIVLVLLGAAAGAALYYFQVF